MSDLRQDTEIHSRPLLREGEASVSSDVCAKYQPTPDGNTAGCIKNANEGHTQKVHAKTPWYRQLFGNKKHRRNIECARLLNWAIEDPEFGKQLRDHIMDSVTIANSPIFIMRSGGTSDEIQQIEPNMWFDEAETIPAGISTATTQMGTTGTYDPLTHTQSLQFIGRSSSSERTCGCCHRAESECSCGNRIK